MRIRRGKAKREFEAKALVAMQRLKIMEEFATIKTIIRDKVSLARFGDGEFRVANGADCSSQMRDKTLAHKLLGVLKNDTPGLCVGILKPEMGWQRYYIKPKIIEQLNYASQYYSMAVTRVDQASHINCSEYWELCKKIWENRDIVIVYGGKRIGEHLHKFKPAVQSTLVNYGRSRNFEVRIEDEDKINLKKISIDKYIDAFDNVRSINSVEGYHICASLGYKEVIRDVCQFPKTSLIYLALGSAATALAKDLHLLGYQALDMGHWGRYYRKFKIEN
jgi:hypothetical protein